jgi:hypothetical protein
MESTLQLVSCRVAPAKAGLAEPPVVVTTSVGEITDTRKFRE